MNSKVSIIIPIFNNWSMTHQQLWDLYRKERENIDQVLVVDDCSTDKEVQEGLKWWSENRMFKEFHQIFPEENLGFLLASCLGFYNISGKLYDDDIVILLSNDVMIRGKFISQIKSILEENPKSLVGGILYSYNTGWNEFDGKIFPYLEGWFLATTNIGWRELNYLDTQFARNDYEDIDVSTTALQKGYQLVPLNNVGLHHLGAKTIGYNEKRLEQTNINKEKFRKKWINYQK